LFETIEPKTTESKSFAWFGRLIRQFKSLLNEIYSKVFLFTWNIIGFKSSIDFMFVAS
jgi:hypothetical protein